MHWLVDCCHKMWLQTVWALLSQFCCLYLLTLSSAQAGSQLDSRTRAGSRKIPATYLWILIFVSSVCFQVCILFWGVEVVQSPRCLGGVLLREAVFSESFVYKMKVAVFSESFVHKMKVWCVCGFVGFFFSQYWIFQLRAYTLMHSATPFL
jgi:hypothetical protein